MSPVSHCWGCFMKFLWKKPTRVRGRNKKKNSPEVPWVAWCFSVSASSMTSYEGIASYAERLKDALLCCSSFNVIVHANFWEMLKVTMPWTSRKGLASPSGVFVGFFCNGLRRASLQCTCIKHGITAWGVAFQLETCKAELQQGSLLY